MSITGLILLLLLYIILRPLIRFYLAYRRVRNQFTDRKRSENPRTNQRDERPAGWSSSHPHRKIITPEMGEYIKFEESSTTTTVTDSDSETETTTTSTSTEQQITDVEWEDIP